MIEKSLSRQSTPRPGRVRALALSPLAPALLRGRAGCLSCALGTGHARYRWRWAPAVHAVVRVGLCMPSSVVGGWTFYCGQLCRD